MIILDKAKGLLNGMPLWLRSLIYWSIFAVVWADLSLAHFLQNRPEAFQAAGSIIVAGSVFFLARERLGHEAAVSEAERQSIVTAINKLQKYREIDELRLNVTFNTYLLQISQISKHVGVPNPIGPETTAEIKALAQSIDEETGGKSEIEPPPEDKYFADAMLHLSSVRNEISPWIKVVWKVELFFLIFGTIQWGYGNQWVTWFHIIDSTL